MVKTKAAVVIMMALCVVCGGCIALCSVSAVSAYSESALVTVIPTEQFTPVRIGAPVQRGTTGAVVFIDTDGDGIEETPPVWFWYGERDVDRAYRQEWPFPGWHNMEGGQ